MKRVTVLIAAAALAALAACDRADDRESAAAGAGTSTGTGQAQGTESRRADTPSTPANVGTPSATERRDGARPIEGQVDSKEPEQRRDFQKR